MTSELGAAFKGTGRSLGQIIDTSNSFIRTADANFTTTTALIKDSNVVLQTQVGQGVLDPHLLPRPGPVQRHPGRQRRRPAQADRQRQRHLRAAAHLPPRQRRRARLADQQPGDHRAGRGQAPQGHPPGAGPLPLRRRGWLQRHRPGQPRAQVRRQLRAGADQQPGLPRGLQREGAQARPDRRHPDGHHVAVHGGAVEVQRPRHPELARTAGPRRRRTGHPSSRRTIAARARSPGPTRTPRPASSTPVAPTTASARTRGSRCCSSPWRRRSRRVEHPRR